MSRLHISLDDTKGIFKVLSLGKVSSIFETRTLDFLKEMHEEYGSVFDLYCTYSDGEYNLGKVLDDYADEFMENASWLRFGFHCYNEREENKEDISDFKVHYEKFNIEIERVTGQINFPKILRIHGFKGNKEICDFLRKSGVKTLLASDDSRMNYYLDEVRNGKLLKERHLHDDVLDIDFVTSCVRLENAKDIIYEIDKRYDMGDLLIPVFTHEWQMDREDVRNKLELCCKWGMR